MEEVLKLWFSKAWYEQILNLGIIIGGVILLGRALLAFIQSLRKDAKLKVSKNGVELESGGSTGFPMNREDMSPMELKFFNLIQETERKKEVEIQDLKNQINLLQSRILELEMVIKLKTTEEEIKKKYLLPLTQHEYFSDMTSWIDRGIDLNAVDISEEKKAIVKAFLEKCKMPVFRDRMREYVLDNEPKTESERMAALYDLPNKVLAWIDEYELKAKELKVILPNGYIFGCTDVFIEKFNDWHKSHVNITYDRITSIIQSSFYQTWHIRIILILDLLDTMFSITIDDAIRTAVMLNGEMEAEIKSKMNVCS